MLGMKRHVPRQKPDRRCGQQGTAVRQHIVIPFGAAGMFGQQIGAQERLADQQRQQQIGDKPPGRRQHKANQGPCQQHDPRLTNHHSAHRFRHIGVAPPPGRIAKQHPQIAKPEGCATQIQKIAAKAMRLWRRQFGIAARILGEFVMILMKIEEPARRDQKHQSGDAANHAVQPAAAEGRRMAAFMHGGEQECHGDPLPGHGKPAPRAITCHIAPQAQSDQPEMPAKMDQAAHIRTRRQRTFFVC